MYLVRELEASLLRAQAKEVELVQRIMEHGRRLEETLGEQHRTLLVQQKMLAQQNQLLASMDKKLSGTTINPMQKRPPLSIKPGLEMPLPPREMEEPVLRRPPQPFVCVEAEFGAPELTARDPTESADMPAQETKDAPHATQSQMLHKRDVLNKVVCDVGEDGKRNRPHSVRELVISGALFSEGRGFLTEFFMTPAEEQAKSVPQRYCARFVMGQTFNILVGVVIVANSVFIFMQSDWAARHLGEKPPKMYAIAETTFFFFFFAELMLRLWVFRCQFFFGSEWRWNWFDTFIIAAAGFDEVMKLIDAGGSLARRVTGLRVLRSIKLTRVVRMIRLLRLFRELRIMVASIISTVATLGWAILCLVMIKLAFAVFFLTMTTDYQVENGPVKDFDPYFGSMAVMLITLFQLTTGGFDWREMADLLSFSPMSVVVLCMYIAMMHYAILNILIGICCDTASKTAEEDFEISVHAEQEREDNATAKLKDFFHDADTDRSGNITWSELEQYLKEPGIRSAFKKIDLERWHLKTFFDLLKTVDDEDPAIGIDDFIRGCTRLRYQVKNIDLIAHSHAQQETRSKKFYELAKLIESLNHATSSLRSQKFHELSDKIDCLYQAVVVANRVVATPSRE